MRNCSSIVFSTLVAFFLLLCPFLITNALADGNDQWWDDDWPYRFPVSISGSGVGQVSIDFSQAFSQLGLNGALLDVRSIRVIPYNGAVPKSSVPYEETYCIMIEDADNPQIGFSASADYYWNVFEGSAAPDNSRFSQGSGSLKVTIGAYGRPAYSWGRG